MTPNVQSVSFWHTLNSLGVFLLLDYLQMDSKYQASPGKSVLFLS